MRLINWIRDVIPARCIMAALGFLGFVVNLMLRVNISVALVAMVNHTAVQEQIRGENRPEAVAQCDYGRNTSDIKDVPPLKEEFGEFVWSEETQSLVIGSFFWGYVITQVPGGRVADILGAKYVFGFSTLIGGIVNLAIPFVASTNPTGMIVLRFLLGLAQGTMYPAMAAFLARWAPQSERSLFNAIVYSGSEIGTILAFLLPGFLISTWGWQSVFLVSGGSALAWTALWMLLAFDSPHVHPRLSIKEQELFNVNEERMTCGPIPWKSIFTSLPFWAAVTCSVAGSWQFWTFVHLLPSYMKNILQLDIQTNAILTSSPFLVMWIFELIYGRLADFMCNQTNMSIGTIRKISCFITLVLPTCCMVAMPWAACNVPVIVGLFTMALGFSGAKYSTYFANFIDIAPNFAGTLLGMAYIFISIPGWLSPLIAGMLTSGQQTLDRWRIIFYIAAFINIIGFLSFIAFASGEVQPWNEHRKDNEPKEDDQLSQRTESVETVATTLSNL